jgi:hypothetical protein
MRTRFVGTHAHALVPDATVTGPEADLALEVATVQPGKHSRVLFLSGNGGSEV